MSDEKKLFISSDESLLFALKLMDEIKRKLLIIVGPNNKFINLISIGDIQRSLIKGHSLTEQLNNIVIDKKVVANTSDSDNTIKALMMGIRAEFMPVLDNDGELKNIIFWDDVAEEHEVQQKIKNNIPVVIMAGGKGTRLKPISNVLPKPLIPIGDGSILEEIMNRFESAGTEQFYLSVNYKKKMIEQYLDSINKSDSVKYFSETKPLGEGIP